ncbi:MAG: phospholipase D-like domain-containing protein [Gemmatimonadota bacterium]|nr:phospholipase D-like domain-containing protein [Gemmatimonadota bacterium]
MSNPKGGGGELFIVDNSVSGWTGLRYLQDWTGIAKSFDIATGSFEIGSLLELDGKWQKLDKIRILMGADVTHGTKAMFLKAIKAQAEAVLDQSIEAEKRSSPFLQGVPAVVDALKTKQIECRVYTKDKFHAKAFITHAKLDVVGSRALVGSSNFTRPGLTKNVELNIQVQSGPDVAQLQKWFEEYWAGAEDVTADVLQVIDRHVREYSPFEVYAKALQEFFRGHEITAGEWDVTRSQMFPHLDRYQQEGYGALMKIARQHGGAFLCDGVGLGKTFVGLMLIERLIRHENKRVVLFAPKAAREAVWEPHLREWLPDIGGGSDFSNLAIFNHTDLGRGNDFPERFKRIAEFADAVIVDEAHHFRNPGRLGTDEDRDGGSRYRRLFRMLDGSVRPKAVFLLTATPINNRLADFRHMAELFSRREENYFARTLGINNLRAHFANLEKELRKEFGGTDVAEGEAILEAQELLSTSSAFQGLVVQRSRAYARESQLREGGSATVFPEREAPRVADYSIRKTYGQLLDDVESAFSKDKPLFSLALYYPLAYYTGPDESINPVEQNRQAQVVGLIRTNFLKRFESSVWAFEQSCNRLLRKLLAFVEVHSTTNAEKKRLDRWMRQNVSVLDYVQHRQLALWGDADDEEIDEDVVSEEMLAKVVPLDADQYAVDDILDETYLDLDQIIRFIAETKKFEPKHDDKLQKLIRLLKSKELGRQKVLIFTEFADTARYLHEHLEAAGIEGIEQIDSASKKNRAEVIKRFSPYYNGASSGELAAAGQTETRVLISTDVLSEGLNLQDAARMINYDIHWNPVRLMQRIGRVDRRLNPEVEIRLKADHPDVTPTRGTVIFWNFLPPEELNEILSLYTKVTQKTLLISRTMGIEGKKLLTPEDDYEALKQFNDVYEGTTSVVEGMHLEYQELMAKIPALGELLEALPGGVFSGRRRSPGGGLRGAFFCFALPALDRELEEFTEVAGTARWYFFDVDRDEILEEPTEIIDSIRAVPETPRVCAVKQADLVAMRARILTHIKNTYLKRINAPVGVGARLVCWMELNDG